MSQIDNLRSVGPGDRVRVATDEGAEYVVIVADEVDYVVPDEYGAGHLSVPVEFDTDVHEVPTDELPENTGEIVARRESSEALGQPKLLVKAPDVEEHTGARVERWDTLGRVVSVDVIDEYATD